MPATSADISILATGRPVRIPTPDGKIWLANYDRNFRTITLAGSELSQIAVKNPSYVDKLVYLDAYDISERLTFPNIPYPTFTDADFSSLFTYQAAFARQLGDREPIPDVCLNFEFDKDGMITRASTPESITKQLLDGAILPAHPPTNWADIKQPRLGIFALYTLEAKLPWYPYLSPTDQAIFDERFPRLVQWYSDVVGLFGEEHPGSLTPVVYLLPGAPHYVYINHEAEVVLQMRNFLGIPLVETDKPTQAVAFPTEETP